MKRFIGNIKDKLSGSQSNQNRDQQASSSSHAGQGQRASSWRSWGSSKDEEPPAYSSLDPTSPSAGPADSKSAPSLSPAPAPAPVLSRAPTPRAPERWQKYSNNEDPFAFLTFFDTIFVIDDSGSMSGKRWKEVANVLRSITPICTSHDSDGIDLYFLNYKSKTQEPKGKAKGGFYNIKSPEEITQIFKTVSPSGATPMGIRLWNILKPYVEGLPKPKEARKIEDIKPINIIAITDGDPSDDPGHIIAKYAKDLDALEAPPHQVGIQFFQVGNDPRGQEALKHLDDEVGKESGVRDMVDTVSWDKNPFNPSGVLSADSILKVVLGAVVRRLDKIKAGAP